MKTLLTVSLMLWSWLAFSQSSGPISGPSRSFGLSPDNIGDVSNNMNLFTGDAAFTVPIAGLPGRNGLSASLTIDYNSNVHKEANTWNMEAPTSALGLGWSLDFPKIIVDNKNTGTREDDEYFLSEGGSSNRLLYRGGEAATGKTYYTKNYQFWSILFFPAEEKWVIVKEDGTKYIYGDLNSGRSTVQWAIAFRNWMGSSNVTTSTIQKQIGIVWNLSEVVNVWGDKITYAYLNVNQKVGSSAGKEHTEASYLSAIMSQGMSIHLTYGEKTTDEYMEPHTENGSNVIDAYQERYERNFLEYVTVYDYDGTQLSKTRFNYYSMLGTGNLRKRLLTSIVPQNFKNESLPGYEFLYNTTTGFNLGALKTMTLPSGGTVNYTYIYSPTAKAQRDFIVPAYAGYAEPKVWIGPDYVVLTRRQLSSTNTHTADPRNVRLEVFEWDGQWTRWNYEAENIPGIIMVDEDEDATVNSGNEPDYFKFHVTLQKEFFAIAFRSSGATENTIWIYHKDDLRRNRWIKRTFTEQSTDVSLKNGYRLVSGDNFVCFSHNKGALNVYTWSGDVWSPNIIPRSTNTHNPVVAGHNYMISHKRGAPDIITFYFLQENFQWTTRVAPMLIDAATDNRSNWYPAASFAVIMANQQAEQILSWDENYNFLPTYNTGQSIDVNTFVDIVDDAMVGFLTPDGTPTGYSHRFNGSTWSYGGSMDYYGPSTTFRYLQSYGSDFIIRPRENGNIGLRTYNPNTHTWANQDVLSKNSFMIFAGTNYFVKGDDNDKTKAMLVYRNPSGSFVKDPSPLIELVQDPWNNANEVRFGWFGGFDYVIKSYNSIEFSNILRSGRFKNGKVDSAYPNFQPSYARTDGTVGVLEGVMHEYGTFDPTRHLASGNTFIAFLNPLNPNPGNSGNYQQNAQQVAIHRVIDTEALGYLNDFPVRQISFTDGEKTSYTSLGYDVNTAMFDASGSVCMYNKVTVYPGSDGPFATTNGKIEYHFLNGISFAEADAAGTAVGWQSDDFSRINRGLMYRKKVFNSQGNVVAETWNRFDWFWKQAWREYVYYIRPITQTQTLNEITMSTTNSYNTTNGMVWKKTTTTPGNDNINQVVETNKYWYEVHDPTMAQRLLSPVIQTTTTVNGIVRESNAIKYASFGGVPAPAQTYYWKRTGSSDFSAWSSTPSADWTLTSSVDARNIKGMITQTTDSDGMITKLIFDSENTKLLARVLTRVPSAYVYYNGFELNNYEECFTCARDAKVGRNSSTTVTNVTGIPNGTYNLTYWKKTSATATQWDLVQTTFTGTSVSVPAYADEIRIFPDNVDITSYGYDRFGNITAENDNNNFIKYTEYDNFQRPFLIRDTNKNILQSTNYTTKRK